MADVAGNDTQSCKAMHDELYTSYAALMTVIFILALPLNASVIHLFIFKLKFWKTKTNNVFLFNLMLADILLLFCLPIKIDNYLSGVRMNEGRCKFTLFLRFLNRGASVAFLTIISIDRYFNVVHPGRKNLLKVLKKSPHISIIIWLLLLPLTIPTMLTVYECCRSFKENNNTVEYVVDAAREVVFFSQILIPFAILLYCTVNVVSKLRKTTVGDRTKLKRAVFLVTTVMVVFSICFLPSTIGRMVLLIVRIKYREDEKNSPENTVIMVFDGLMILSYLDCLLDPLVYCFGSAKFKSLYLSNYCPFLVKSATVPPESTTGYLTTQTTNATSNGTSPKIQDSLLPDTDGAPKMDSLQEKQLTFSQKHCGLSTCSLANSSLAFLCFVFKNGVLLGCLP
ncbi:12-(S)-hydroxy-5,8,10,14-eicosatetraenoic acid receptor-like [Pholidichthys leucotaenia]